MDAAVLDTGSVNYLYGIVACFFFLACTYLNNMIETWYYEHFLCLFKKNHFMYKRF